MPQQSTLNGSDLSDQLTENIKQQESTLENTLNQIQQKDSDLRNKIQRSIMQQREIDYKQKLIETRNRMLQLSQEKNMYKSKVIYTLLAVVMLLTIIILAIYIYFNK